jgi:hypothetical protein
MQCECCFKSPVGRHVVISGQRIDPAAGAPALNQPQGLTSSSNFVDNGTAVVIAASLRRQWKPFGE